MCSASKTDTNAVSSSHRLFYTVGVFGYLYAYDETRDNILLNFPLSTTTVLVGRIGYGITIMFGMPLVFLPCRAAILSLPTQIKEWRDAFEEDNVHGVETIMKGTKHSCYRRDIPFTNRLVKGSGA